jgi:hypothetical protein
MDNGDSLMYTQRESERNKRLDIHNQFQKIQRQVDRENKLPKTDYQSQVEFEAISKVKLDLLTKPKHHVSKYTTHHFISSPG